MRRPISWLVTTAVAAVAAVSVQAVAAPTRALASPQFLYGVDHAYGKAAVDYIYGEHGMWRQLSDVQYLWNYYKDQSSEFHLYDREALIAWADGTHQTTARDANGHLLLDVDLTNDDIERHAGGPAFFENNGLGAGGQRFRPPFSNFWYDDNWLARYMAQAYGRPEPDGLSEYNNFVRWRILHNDASYRTITNRPEFDLIALDGLHYLATDRVNDAFAKWRQLRDSSGLQVDFHTGLFLYTNINEHYHAGLFKILTDQLLASGGLSDSLSRELVQHSASLRARLVQTQQRAGATRAGWLSRWPNPDNPNDHPLMNTETIAVSALALAAGVRDSFAPGEAPLRYRAANGYEKTDYGTLGALPGQDRAGFLTFGPYLNYPSGSYTAQFVLRSFGAVDKVARLEVFDAQSRRIIASRELTAANFDGNSDWVRFDLPFTVSTAPNQLEFRTWWYGSSDVEIGEIRIR